MFCYSRIITATFSFVLTITYNSASTIEEMRLDDMQFDILLACLLSAGVDGSNIHHRNSGIIYDELNWQWNTLNGYLRPLAYLVPTNVSDVRRAVVCCRLSKIRIVLRSGGHSYVKNGFGDSRSLVVDLSKLNEISLNPMEMTCEVGAGARLGQIIYTLWENGKFLIPGGDCPTVGIAGLTLGGGYGRFSTSFGLTSDNVIEMEMIDSNGQLLVINNSSNSDLYWALRGGGGGNFGIVTKFKFKMHSAPTSIVYGRYECSFDDFSRFYVAWQTLFVSDIPRHFSPIFVIENDRIKMGLFAFNFQHQNETTTDSMRSFINQFPFPMETHFSIQVMSYVELMVRDGERFSHVSLTDLSQLGTVRKDGAVGWKKVKSIFSDKILNENQIAMLKKLFGDLLQHSDTHFYVEPAGGAIDSLSPSDTAFIHRGANFFQIQLSVSTAQNKRPNLEADHAMTMFYEKSKLVFNHRESYQNFLDQDIDDYLERYYGKNLRRLVKIKREVDPNNVFHHPQSIPVNFKCGNRGFD